MLQVPHLDVDTHHWCFVLAHGGLLCDDGHGLSAYGPIDMTLP